jgi:two-component system, NarL family, sensor histidine kinase UhpB
MWRKVSLQRRLNLIFGALLLLWFAVDVGRFLIEAGPRAQTETQSAARLTRDFVETTLAHLQDAPEPARAVEALVASLQYLRHVRVGYGEQSLPATLAAASVNPSPAPEWFRAMVSPPIAITSIPVILGQHNYAPIIIVADPSDVIDEIWSAAKTQAASAAALALAVLLATSFFLNRSLKPLKIAGATLGRLKAGDFAVRAQASGSPEFVDICARINDLARALGDLSAENSQLIERLFDAHDEERKAIAGELHDEIGPHLFALRANAAILASRLSGDGEERKAAIAIGDQIEALQRHNRRILANLRPAALEELGLVAALQALIEQWRRAEPGVKIALAASDRIARLGPRASLMAYRFVQEALTNAFRHSGARHIDVKLAYDSPPSARQPRDPALTGLRIHIRDDGRGLSDDVATGMGLSFMRDRVKMLGGEVAIRSGADGGTIVEAIF